jgi:hypothetical protein
MPGNWLATPASSGSGWIVTFVWYGVDDDAQLVDIFYVGPKTTNLYAKLGLERP